MRLAKFLAATTPLSRRDAEVAIAAGHVTINHKWVTSPAVNVTPGVDRVAYRGEVLRLQATTKLLAFYKPRQVVVARRDPQRRKTIWDLLPAQYHDFEAVGRLDYDSEGLLLLTNDGSLVNRLTHPRYHLPKTYAVRLQGRVSDAALEHLRQGVRDGDELLQAAAVTRRAAAVGRTREAPRRGARVELGNDTWIDLVLTEGKYRQIRRMCEKIGHPVVRLKRIAIGEVHLPKTLAPGAIFRLPPAAARALLHAQPTTTENFVPKEKTAKTPCAPQSNMVKRPSKSRGRAAR